MIVHQQRAHQKILFDQFITNGDKNDSQQLLFPQTIELSAQDLSIVKENTEQLLDLGFRFDYLNKNSIVILGIPELMSQDNLNNTIEEILEEYKNSLSAKTNHSKNLIQATSISLSINSGRALSQIEMSNLIDQLFSLETPQSGLNNKKTYITISNQEIANKFNL